MTLGESMMKTDKKVLISIVVAVSKNEQSIGPFLARLEKAVQSNGTFFE
jgi:hypothetical protein